MNITTVDDIEKKKKKETFEEVEKKPLIQKLTPEQIKIKKVELESLELELRDNKILIELLEREIKEEIPMRRKRLQIKGKYNELEETEWKIKTIKRMVKQSQRN